MAASSSGNEPVILSEEPVILSEAPVILSEAKDLQLRDWRLAIAVIVASGLVRLAIAAFTPLFPDETYYWEWSRHLAAGYFDHPPMIAVLVRLGTSIAGDTPVGVRLGSVVAGTLGIWFVCATARRTAGDRAAFLAAIVFAVMPLSAAGLVLATPDAPLLAAAAASVYAVVRALECAPRSRGSLNWWTMAGLALGLAFCSKYTAVLLPLGVFIALLSRADLRERLAEPGPYAAALVATVIFLPVVVWNARHGWVSFAFQLQHGFGAGAGSALKRELELIGGQAGLVSPILFVMCVVAIARELRSPSSMFGPLLAIIPIVVFGFFMYSATKRRVEANWPALAYLSAVLLLVARSGDRLWDRWLRVGLGVSALLTIVAYVNAFVPVLPVPARRDPAARASGWRELAHTVSRVPGADSQPLSRRRWIAADRYQEASALSFYLPAHPATFSLNLSGRANQYDLWPSFSSVAREGDALILVVDDVAGTHPTAASLAPHFASLRQGELVPLARDSDLVKNLRIWVLDGWRGTWPGRPLRSRS